MKKILSFCAIYLFALSTFAQSTIPVDTNWNQLSNVLTRIKAPTFPNVAINIVNLGAPTNGTTIATSYIQKAIDSCTKIGGGRVVIPAGTFLTGALTLKNNVNLYISKNATLKFSTNTNNYLPVVLTRFESVECYNFSPFIYSYGASNIAVTGSGTLDGQASNSNWWAWKTSAQATTDNNLLNQQGQDGVPVEQRVYGSGHQLRPAFIQFYNSKNILIDSVTIINSPMWEVNPVLSENVTVSNITINSHGPNNDGCDPECCKDVLIYNCSFSTGDDCIAVKSGRNNDGRRVNVPCQYVVIQKCTMADGHGAVTLGSECSGGINNVFAEDCNMSSTNLGTILRFKTNSLRGGIIENIFMRNCTVGQITTGDILDVDMNYQEGDVGTFTPVIRNIELNNVTCAKSASVWNVDAYARSPLTDIKIINCNFSNAFTTGTLTNVSRLQVYNSFINNKIPLIPTNATGFTEAETYSNKSSWGWSNVLTGYSGNAYMEFADSSNYIEWTTTRTSDEIDTLNIRYANTDTVTKPCTVLVNGTNAGQFTFSSTQSNWANEKKNIFLYKGTNTIRLVAFNNKPGAYIDRFSTMVRPAMITLSDTFALCPNDDLQLNSGMHGNRSWQWQINTDTGFANIYDNALYTGTTNDTLHLTNLPDSLYGNQYRCVITAPGSQNLSHTFVIKFAVNWTGAVSTLWEDPANWACGIIPDTNTDVIIKAPVLNYPVVNDPSFARSVSVYSSATLIIHDNSLLNIGRKQ
ncbi:glycosyl hydrolase family 28 protein [Ferruginibacter albus]|uniref:glycosyl hydrolase family 28 protein n=1 Tax=Ferruginibacter albus TaxID=2875540 RepID=UPI001CC6F88A|nr:glycosyl hydrolase family 28 protein [Ferruginibacter albus]UAY51123.1 hypothetical protein K9M53_11030 [Ferruginibacter albus]